MNDKPYCLTFAAQISAEVYPVLDLRLTFPQSRQDTCSRCGKKTTVMRYALEARKESDHAEN